MGVSWDRREPPKRPRDIAPTAIRRRAAAYRRSIRELSHKSKFMRKHGRTIVASGGMFDAIIALGTWTSRVNRIARKYKTPTIPGRAMPNERTGQDQSAEGGPGYAGANGGRIVDGVTIINPG